MTTSSQPSPIGVRDLLQIPDFRLLWLGQIVSNFGDALTHLTLVLFINRVTGGSTTAIATLLIALALPQATVGLIAGVFVDRWDRKRIMIVSDILRGGLVLAFILLPTSDGRHLGWLYLIAFVHSMIGSFFLPARSATIPNVVPHSGLLAANSLAQMSVVFFRLLGTAVAGFIVGLIDTFWPAFVLDAVTFFLSALLISQIALDTRVARQAKLSLNQNLQAIKSQLGEGIGLMARSRLLVGTMVAIGVTMLGLGAINVLLAPLIVNDLQVSETWFGAIEFAQTGGMLLSGAIVAGLAARFKPTHIISSSLAGLGLCLLPLALITQIWHLFPILFAIGLLATPLNAAVATIVQTAVADEARGRVSSALGAVIQVASLLSMFAAGAVAATIGVRNVFVLGGVIVISAGLASALVFRGQRLSAPAAEAQPTLA